MGEFFSWSRNAGEVKGLPLQQEVWGEKVRRSCRGGGQPIWQGRAGQRKSSTFLPLRRKRVPQKGQKVDCR